MLTEDNFLQYLDKVTPQWIAGFFDGEGCIHARLEETGITRLRVTICQKEQWILMLIALRFPPSRMDVVEQKIKNGGKIKYRTLYYNGRNAIPLLEAIKDFVIVKRELVLSALKFASLITDSHNHLSEEAKSEREVLLKRISEINGAKRAYEM